MGYARWRKGGCNISREKLMTLTWQTSAVTAILSITHTCKVFQRISAQGLFLLLSCMCPSYKGIFDSLLQNENTGNKRDNSCSARDPAVRMKSPSQFTFLSFYGDSLSGTNEPSASTSQVHCSVGGFIGPRGTVRAPLSSGSHWFISAEWTLGNWIVIKGSPRCF